MEEGISGASPEEARFSIERGPAIEARNKTNNVELALEGLRKRPPTELATRDGHNLLQAAIVDQQAHQQQGEPDTKEVERLRGLDTSLAKLTAKGASELTYEQTRQLRVYFKEEKEKWDRFAEGSTNKAITVANRDVFAAILADVRNNLPTMEAILPEYPTYSLAKSEPLLETLPGRFQKIKMSDVVGFYDTFAADIALEKSRTESAHPLWSEQKKAIQQATESWNGKRMDERKPLLVTVKADGKVETTEVDPQAKISTKADDDRAKFTIDPDEDKEYLAGINEFDLLNHLAKLGVVGLSKLQAASPIITPQELDGMRLFIQRLEEGINSGIIKKGYKNTLTKFSNFMKAQFEKADIIRDPAPQFS